jgi:hypothetical protein
MSVRNRKGVTDHFEIVDVVKGKVRTTKVWNLEQLLDLSHSRKINYG